MKKFIFGLLAGISAGILFAPKSGKKLRQELKDSNAKFSDFGRSLLNAASDAGSEVQEFVKSQEMQEILNSGKKSAEDFFKFLEQKSGDLSRRAQDELGELVENAIDAAKDTRKTVEEKADAVKKDVASKAQSVKKAVTKKMK